MDGGWELAFAADEVVCGEGYAACAGDASEEPLQRAEAVHSQVDPVALDVVGAGDDLGLAFDAVGAGDEGVMPATLSHEGVKFVPFHRLG